MVILNDFQTSVARALSEINPKWRDLPGLIVCGTHAPHDVDYMLNEIKEARESGLPFLGICFGNQLAAIEYARNVLGITDATSEEFGEGTFIVKKRVEPQIGLREGESYWSYYEVDPEFYPKWRVPENFFLSAYHPEYNSYKGNPHPLLVEFLEACKKYE